MAEDNCVLFHNFCSTGDLKNAKKIFSKGIDLCERQLYELFADVCLNDHLKIIKWFFSKELVSERNEDDYSLFDFCCLYKSKKIITWLNDIKYIAKPINWFNF